jgi:RNA polymerase-binding transcription factor DksA
MTDHLAQRPGADVARGPLHDPPHGEERIREIMARVSDDARGRLLAEAQRAREQLAALTREFDAVVAAAEARPPDDEHDPDGATVGFERAQLTTLIDTTRQHLRDLDAALLRVDAGEYGRCVRCGEPIAPERLAALPGATLCVTCAANAGTRRRAP